MKRVSSLFVICLLIFMLAGCPSIQTMKDPTLKALLFNSLAVPDFDPDITEYSIELPIGTTEVPTITTIPNVEGVTIEVINAETLPGTTTIIVTALDGKTVTTYHIYFTVQKNNDSSLKALEYNDMPVPGFNDDKLDYEIILPAGTIDLPTISATASDANATITITQVLELPGTAEVTVTADDGITTSTYLIYFIPQYFIAASSNPSDGGTITGAGNYVHGSQVNLIATPNEGYEFVDWTDNGVQVSTKTNYSFTADADRALVANFRRITYSITINVNPTDGGSVSGGGTYNSGDEVTVVATPNQGNHFINWTESAIEVSKEPVYTFTATRDRDLVANFEMNHAPEFDKLLPADGAVNQSTDVKLEWNAVDPDGANVTYDVYFGYSASNLNKVLESSNLNEYYPEVIKGFTFYWRVIASNGSATKDSGVMAFSTIEEVLTDKSIHIIDNLLNKQPSDPEAMVVQVKGIGTVSGSEIEIEIDTDYMEFMNIDGQILSEFLASNPEATFANFEPWCEYKAMSTDLLSIIKLKDATGSTVSLSGAYTNSAGNNIADGDLWFIYVKTKARTGRTAAVFSSASFVDNTLVEIPVDSSDQGLFIVK